MALSHDRGYELVTPPDKPQEMAGLFFGIPFGTTADGNRAVFYSQGALLSGTEVFPSTFRAERSATGWTVTSPVPTAPQAVLAPQVIAFSADAERMLVRTQMQYSPTDDDDLWISDADVYKVEPGTTPQLLTPNTVFPKQNDQLVSRGVAEDARSVIVSAGQPLLPEAVGAADQIYESRGGVLRLVAVDTAGVRLTSGRAALGSLVPISANAYSKDASRIFFTTNSQGDPTDRVGLWVRINGETTDPIPAGSNDQSNFLGATPNGRTAFFATPVGLDAADTDGGSDLYAYDTVTKAVTWLSQGAGTANVQIYPVWSTEDGSRVYFTAAGNLVPGEGSPTGNKTYVWDDGAIRLIADAGLIPDTNEYLPGQGGFECGPTRMSPDGRYFLTVTPATLVAGDHDGGADDVYRYDLATDEWALVSTGPADAEGADDARVTSVNHYQPGARVCSEQFFHLTRAMSDDGQHVFFQTSASLVPEDSNGKWDVYEWDAATGKSELVSSGLGTDDADFLDATPSGSDVFFLTRARLVAADIDASTDVYDARVGGGFPEPVPTPPCRESECQGAPAPQPGDAGSPGSLSDKAGNPAGPARSVRRLVVQRLSAAKLRALARGRTVRLVVVPARTGRLRVSTTVTVGKRRAAVPSVLVSGRAGRPVTVALKLGAKARAVLRKPGARRLRVVAHQLEVRDASRTYVLPRVTGRAR